MANNNLTKLDTVLSDLFFNKWDLNDIEKTLNNSLNGLNKRFNNFNFNRNKTGRWIDCGDYWTLTIYAKTADIEVDADYLKYKYEEKRTNEYGTYTRSGDVKIPFPEGADTTTVRAESKDNKIVVKVDRKAKVYNKARKIDIKY